MGAFFLFKSQEVFDKDGVSSVFTRKGFAAPNTFDLNGITLWLYKKQLVHDENFYLSADGSGVYVVGTVVYRGLSWNHGLQALLRDFQNRCLDKEELLGSFCIIFHANGSISVLNDRLNVYHFFTNKKRTIFSSSFLAMLRACSGKLRLNKQAFLEQVITGHITGPDTLVEGVDLVVNSLHHNFSSGQISFIENGANGRKIEYCNEGVNKCVEHQVETLRNYFRKITPLASDNGIDLGLSGGHDSRLAFLLATEVPARLTVHTHWTDSHHDIERKIAYTIARSRNIEVKCIKTRPPVELTPDEIEEMMTDGIFFFDGRNAYDMGSFSQTYTKDYRLKVLGQNRLGLTGLGGEVYRNYYFILRNRVNFKYWIQNNLLYPDSLFFFKKNEDLLQILDYKIKKVENIINSSINSFVDMLLLKRYYSEVHMPFCDGANHNANHQLCYYLSPFIEYKTIREAYKAIPYLGISGEFQNHILLYLAPDIRDIMLSNGYSPDNVSFKYKLYSWIKGYSPDAVLYWKRRLLNRPKNIDSQGFDRIYLKSPVVRTCYDYLCDNFPEYDWAVIKSDYIHYGNIIHIAFTMLSFDDCFRL